MVCGRYPIEELVEYLAFDFIVGRPTDTGSFRDTYDPQINIQRFLSFGTNTESYIIIDPYTLTLLIALLMRFLLQMMGNFFWSPQLWGDECVCACVCHSHQN